MARPPDTRRPKGRLVCARGWWGGRARNQRDTSRPTRDPRVKHSAGWYDTPHWFFRAWDWIEQTLVGVLGLAALVIGVVQVVGRYFVPEHAITWAEEVIVYLAIWAIMIVSSQLVRTDGHVRPDVVLRMVPPRVQRVMEIFNCIVALIFCGGLIWFGWEIVNTALMLDETSSTGLEFPMWIYYASLPTGGALMFIRYVIRLIRYVFFFDPERMTVGHTLHDMPLDMTMPTGE